MMFDDDAKPKKKPVHEIGQDLSLLSLTEITERITQLEAEIIRLKEAHARKQSSQAAADALFKR
ncbi:DUF1192 domain-containing protein [Rhabdaerophilum sp. SD176]|uniref:DUF1192 domain-containing protein n=1 Tax=Rhabdaerophilum sp. SD176 TaxID=2983548 RepID=UPI0024DFB90E|nr:DUF1192 domain-containing protein [Rhabdaerophilum sp. SD176]